MLFQRGMSLEPGPRFERAVSLAMVEAANAWLVWFRLCRLMVERLGALRPRTQASTLQTLQAMFAL